MIFRKKRDDKDEYDKDEPLQQIPLRVCIYTKESDGSVKGVRAHYWKIEEGGTLTFYVKERFRRNVFEFVAIDTRNIKVLSIAPGRWKAVAWGNEDDPDIDFIKKCDV